MGRQIQGCYKKNRVAHLHISKANISITIKEMIHCAALTHSEPTCSYLFTDVLFSTEIFSPSVILIFLFLVLQCDVTANSLTAPAADNATMPCAVY